MIPCFQATAAIRRAVVAMGCLALSATVMPALSATRHKPDPICASLNTFVVSVKPDEKHKIEFRTSWFSNSKDPEVGQIGKRCDHGGYEPARAACAVLMKNTSIEFAGSNAMRIIECLSPGTRFSSDMQLDHIDVEFQHGSESRGQLISLQLKEPNVANDPRVITIEVEGY
jgi:hypothetical protein